MPDPRGVLLLAGSVLYLLGCVGVTILWSGIASVVILKLIDVVIGLRVSAEEESQGLDLSLHGETGYNM